MVYMLQQQHHLSTICPIISTVIHHSTYREGGKDKHQKGGYFPREITKYQQVKLMSGRVMASHYSWVGNREEWGLCLLK